jgi:hypothetical protein
MLLLLLLRCTSRFQCVWYFLCYCQNIRKQLIVISASIIKSFIQKFFYSFVRFEVLSRAIMTIADLQLCYTV